MELEMVKTEAGQEAGRDVFSVRARLMDGDDYVQYIVAAMPGIRRIRVFGDVSDHALEAALLRFAAMRATVALGDGRIPLKDPLDAYEIRVDERDLDEFRTLLDPELPALDHVAVERPTSVLATLDPRSLVLRRLALRNLYSFGDRDGEPVLIDLDREATVLIGPNGSGKSNVLRAIEFVRDQSLRKGTQWTGRRDTPRFAGAQASSWTEARLEFADAAQVVVQVICRFDDQGALVQHVIIVAGREVASTRTDFFKGTARWLSEDDEAGRLRVHTADTQAGEPFYAVADLDQVHPNLVVILRYLESLRVYRKWRTSSNASERPADARFDAHLTDDLSNLSGVLGRILKNGPARERLYAEMRQVLPGFESVEVRRPDFDDWYFVEHGATLHADSLSDGSRQFLTLVALLLDPEPTGPLLLDEPDLLLHPDAVIRLGRLLSDAAATRQIVVSTHSSMLLDVLADDQLERVRVVERDADSSVIRMLGSEALEDWLEDFTLADAWGRGAFGGNP